MEKFKHIFNAQKNPKQPIYIIVKYWCGTFEDVVFFSTEGDKDLPKLEKIFQEKYAWKEGTFGITEQTYALIKLDLTEVLDCFGKNLIKKGQVSNSSYINEFLTIIEILKKEVDKGKSLESSIIKVLNEENLSEIVKKEFKKFNTQLHVKPIDDFLDTEIDKAKLKEMKIFLNCLKEHREGIKYCLEKTEKKIIELKKQDCLSS